MQEMELEDEFVELERRDRKSEKEERWKKIGKFRYCR